MSVELLIGTGREDESHRDLMWDTKSGTARWVAHQVQQRVTDVNLKAALQPYIDNRHAFVSFRDCTEAQAAQVVGVILDALLPVARREWPPDSDPYLMLPHIEDLVTSTRAWRDELNAWRRAQNRPEFDPMLMGWSLRTSLPRPAVGHEHPPRRIDASEKDLTSLLRKAAHRRAFYGQGSTVVWDTDTAASTRLMLTFGSMVAGTANAFVMRLPMPTRENGQLYRSSTLGAMARVVTENWSPDWTVVASDQIRHLHDAEFPGRQRACAPECPSRAVEDDLQNRRCFGEISFAHLQRLGAPATIAKA